MSEATEPEREMEAPQSAEELWERYKEHGDQRAKALLIERHTELLRFLAERMCRNLPRSVDPDDLAQEGAFGLFDAIEKYDPSRGVRFKTYCSTRIRGAMLDALRTQDWVPRSVRQRASRIARLREDWLVRYGCEPNDREVAQALDVQVKDLPKMLPKAHPRAMLNLSDRRVSHPGDVEANIDTLGESKNARPDELAGRRDLMDVLTSCLGDKERAIIQGYYLEGLTLRQIGLRLGLTESRICQIHSNILRRLGDRFGPGLNR